MISRVDVEHLGWLSRIELTGEEAEKFAEELDTILGYFKVLDSVDVDLQPLHHVLDLSNVFRDDEVRPSFSQNEALFNAKLRENGYFRAPRIL
ncbi:MAG TPA: Asp-tRNA(Asn)/Glu-tRNA(Gln) amidotransferase subunit GatC [Candidatus Syntrophoarchaeum butanivorans]|uniref:Aspartyl/glutamyl-tRNA(Asn/Gln) amidotransferase subunit C n=1 Tax=Candidatus Syntropharchaeum butanivorans TaxID=1839936 RepID=A0A7C1B6B3_9EURY|nr:Asp-tRNA(Asn)/Glu-tRNA(Gln) amidotransferase subunit GatC [Candidatus Syntrophoarchaeum butanivorans]